jgi:hypothetical protein
MLPFQDVAFPLHKWAPIFQNSSQTSII